MTSYAQTLRVGEFRALLAGHSATVAGKNMQQLALAAVVYGSTGSPLLAAAVFLAGLLPHAAAALTFLSLADRLPPRGALIGWDLFRAALLCLLASGVLPLWALLCVVLFAGAGDAIVMAIRLALVADALREGYVAGRALMNIAVGIMQVVGFGAGGVLLSTIGGQDALWAAAGLSLLSALANRVGLRRRPARGAQPGTVRTTWAGNKIFFGDRRIRDLLCAHWVPNGLIVGAEALYVPYAGDSAGVLFIAAGAGMLLGDATVGRLRTAATRDRLILPLLVLLAVPYLAFLAHPPIPVAAVLVAVASIGFGSTLGVQERLLRVLPEERQGQGLGLATSGMMAMQAIAAALIGSLAELTSTPTAMALAALGSLAVTVWLSPRISPRRASAAGSVQGSDASSAAGSVQDSEASSAAGSVQDSEASSAAGAPGTQFNPVSRGSR